MDSNHHRLIQRQEGSRHPTEHVDSARIATPDISGRAFGQSFGWVFTFQRWFTATGRATTAPTRSPIHVRARKNPHQLRHVRRLVRDLVPALELMFVRRWTSSRWPAPFVQRSVTGQLLWATLHHARRMGPRRMGPRRTRRAIITKPVREASMFNHGWPRSGYGQGRFGKSGSDQHFDSR